MTGDNQSTTEAAIAFSSTPNQLGLRIHVRASYNGINYDTGDLYTFDNHF